MPCARVPTLWRGGWTVVVVVVGGDPGITMWWLWIVFGDLGGGSGQEDEGRRTKTHATTTRRATATHKPGERCGRAWGVEGGCRGGLGRTRPPKEECVAIFSQAAPGVSSTRLKPKPPLGIQMVARSCLFSLLSPPS